VAEDRIEAPDGATSISPALSGQRG
jgi:hypothetical protein